VNRLTRLIVRVWLKVNRESAYRWYVKQYKKQNPDA
jgi:hypothetical protein